MPIDKHGSLTKDAHPTTSHTLSTDTILTHDTVGLKYNTQKGIFTVLIGPHIVSSVFLLGSLFVLCTQA